MALTPARLVAVARRGLDAMEPDARRRLDAILLDDLLTEYDARHLDARLRGGRVPWTRRFQEMESAWLRDEGDHFEGFRRIREALFGFESGSLLGRQADFRHLEEFLEDEFATCLLGAFDELVTIRGYKGNLAAYAVLGDAVLCFVRAVIADEARHYHGFFRLAVEEHAHRLSEGAALLERIRALAGQPYRHTFLLDHDDPVYGPPVFDEAWAILRRRLAAAAASA